MPWFRLFGAIGRVGTGRLDAEQPGEEEREVLTQTCGSVGFRKRHMCAGKSGEERAEFSTWQNVPHVLGKAGSVQGGLGGRKKRALSRVGARSCHKSTFMSKTPDQTFSCGSQIVSSLFIELLYNVISAKYKLNIHGIPMF